MIPPHKKINIPKKAGLRIFRIGPQSRRAYSTSSADTQFFGKEVWRTRLVAFQEMGELHSVVGISQVLAARQISTVFPVSLAFLSSAIVLA